jgi:hypothetical protein
MPNHPSSAVNRDPAKCWRTRPDARVSCTLLAYHDGPHRNLATGEEWENLGEGPCGSIGNGTRCNKDAGHDGQHQNADKFWD